MAREAAVAEVKSFVKGLFTDSTALTFPDNASIDEDNMVLETSGLRRRRLGIDYESSFSEVVTSQVFSSGITIGHTTFRWENAGNDEAETLLAVQFGNEIKFFNLSNSVLSSEVIHTETFDTSTSVNSYSYAVVDGILSVATGQKEVTSFEYNITANTISVSTNTLKVRDLFGLAVTIDGVDLSQGNNVSTRPSTITDEHKYNLRNQSWADPRPDGNDETLKDPISSFFAVAPANYPANSDSVNKAFFADANDTGGRTLERFFASDLKKNRFGNTQTAKGHYIIDAMDRGASRKAAYDQTVSESSATLLTIASLPVDRTEGGPSVLAEFAGRVFYSGFNGLLTGGDNRSPRMSSFVLFSKQVEDIGDVTRCHQDGDPTSIDEPDLLNTDGGFIRINGAFGIKKLLNLNDALFVIAANGVWSITGDDGGFTANAFTVSKITDRGSINNESVIEIENSFSYWSEDGIYTVSKNEFGDWIAASITNNKIDEFYSAIGSENKFTSRGQYDGFDKKIRWIYNTDISSADDVRELVFDVVLQAFYTNTLLTSAGSTLPKTVGIFESNPFSVSLNPEQIVVGSDNVQSSTVDVVASINSRTDVVREVQYVIVTNVDTVIKYTFGTYRDPNWVDYKTFDGTGTDAAAFLLTGYLSGGDFQRTKGITFMTVYANKTETGYTVDGNGDFIAANESSIKLQTQWDWTDDANSNRFSRTFETYRHARLYFPVNVTDKFLDGQSIVVTKNKIRGQGHVISMKFTTSPDKDFQLLGWSLVMSIAVQV